MREKLRPFCWAVLDHLFHLNGFNHSWLCGVSEGSEFWWQIWSYWEKVSNHKWESSFEAMVQCRFLTTIWNKKRIGILISNVIWVNLKELCRSSWLNWRSYKVILAIRYILTGLAVWYSLMMVQVCPTAGVTQFSWIYSFRVPMWPVSALLTLAGKFMTPIWMYFDCYGNSFYPGKG